MIAVLLAPAVVAASRLKVSIGVRANPDSGPSGRNGQRFDPSKQLSIMNDLAVWIPIPERLARFFAPDPGQLISHVSQTDCFSGLDGVFEFLDWNCLAGHETGAGEGASV